MSRFLILDPGLTGAAGPRLNYIAGCHRAAVQAGLQPSVAAHRRFAAVDAAGRALGKAFPVFTDLVHASEA